MEKQVLSIEQMQELKELGIDTSKASMRWVKFTKVTNMRYQLLSSMSEEDNDDIDNFEIIPTFTLQDIINLLPHHIEEKEIGRFDYELIVRKDEVSYDSWEVRSSDGYNLTLNGYDIYNECETLLDCAFEMLKWVKKEKYI